MIGFAFSAFVMPVLREVLDDMKNLQKSRPPPTLHVDADTNESVRKGRAGRDTSALKADDQSPGPVSGSGVPKVFDRRRRRPFMGHF
jgi:hypothetical protein